MAPMAAGGAGPRMVGGAFGTPTSACQFLATSPKADSRISSTKASTTNIDTRPTRSLL